VEIDRDGGNFVSDQNDVQAAIGALLDTIIYPAGAGSASIVDPSNVRIFRGWPVKAQLDADLIVGNCEVSIYPIDGTEGNTTRFPTNVWHDLPATVPTLTWSTNGFSATLTGTVTTPQNVAIVCNGGIFGTYAVQASDTLNSVVDGLAAALTETGGNVSVSGTTITLSGVSSISTRVGTDGKAIRETKRQRKDFMISCWCPTADMRDTLASNIDAALSTVEFLNMPDGTASRMYYHSTKETDTTEKERLWRRDLVYTIEWATTQTISTHQILVVDEKIYHQADPDTLITEVIY
jgi:hypothetical protein